MKKIALVVPRMDKTINEKYTGNKTELSLGIASLLTHLKNSTPATVDFIDLDFEDFNPKTIDDYTIIGINSNVERRENALDLARKIKKINSKIFVILGGTYISCTGIRNIPSMAEICLRNYDFIDAVAVGPGEFSLASLVKGEKLEDTPNLIWRKEDNIIKNKLFFPDLNLLPNPDISLVNPQNYFRTFREKSEIFHKRLGDDYFKFRMPSHKYKGIIPVLSASGCLKAADSGKCNFCSIPYIENIRVKSTAKFWELISDYISLFGEGYIFSDKCDTFNSNKERIQELLKTKPHNLSAPLRIYARLDNLVDGDMVKLLEDLNVKEMQVGLDSFDESIINKMNKKLRPDDVIKAFSNLAKNGIYPVISIIYGFPGETFKSALRTFGVLREIDSILKGRFDIYASPCVPYPSTTPYFKAYTGLLGDDLSILLKNNFLYPIPEVAKKIIDRTTQLEYDGVVHFTKESFRFGLRKTDFLRSLGAEY